MKNRLTGHYHFSIYQFNERIKVLLQQFIMGLYNFKSYECKHSLIFFGIFSIVSDFSQFHEKVIYLKDVLKKNVFPTTLVDKFIKILLNK